MIKKIRNISLFGLIGSLLLVVAAILFKYLCRYAFYQGPQVFRSLTLTASVLVVVDLVVVMSGLRRRIPRLKELPTLDARLQGYHGVLRSANILTFVTVLLVSAIIILTGNYNLLMLPMLLVVTLFFTYPNMYKVKVDLDLSDEEMSALFGDQYVPYPEEPETEMQDPLEKHGHE